MKNDAKCKEIISSIDWSASGDNFQICIASLHGDIDKIVALMPGLAASEAIKARSFREWRVFDWVRDDPRVTETFARVYGEPMRTNVTESVTTVKASDDQQSNPTIGMSSPTRH
jgi:hypothetical protein